MNMKTLFSQFRLMVAKAIVQATRKCVFFGGAAMQMEVTVTSAIPTAATDGKRLLVNEDWFSAQDDGVRAFVSAHEAGHAVLLHCDQSRMAGKEPVRWNVAADHVVNLMLAECGMTAPADCLCDRKYRGLTVEQVYQRLTDEQGQPDKAQQGQQGQQGSGKESEQGDGDKTQGRPVSGNRPGNQPGNGSIQRQIAGDVIPTAAEEAQEVKAAAGTHIHRSIGRGEAPASIMREYERGMAPRKSLADHLREFIQTAATGAENFSYRRPSMFSGGGWLFSTLIGEEVPPIAVCLDTSYSIDSRQIGESVATLTRTAGDVGISRIHLSYCDTALHEGGEYGRGEVIQAQAKGGGGTDFRPIFKWADGLDVCALVIFTDLEGTFPPAAPQYPVLWVNVGRGRAKAPFGAVVESRDN